MAFFNLPITSGTKAERVASGDHLALGQEQQRVGTADLRQRLDDAINQGRRARGRDQMDDDLAVGGGLKNRAATLQPFAQFGKVDQVAVVRHCQTTARILDHQRLTILKGG